MLIQSDGCAVAFGMNTHTQCNIPLLDEGTSYTQVSAGWFHTVFLRSDATVVTCGMNEDGQCNIPPLDVGVSYIQASAGWKHTVLLRSDGIAVACGLAAATYTRNATCRLWSLEFATPEIRFRILGTSF